MLRRPLTACAAVLAGLVPAIVPPADAAASRSGVSANWAGYAVSRPGLQFRTVSASWVQPAVTCSSTRSSSVVIWVGLGGYHSTAHALEQAGTAADCVDATPHYSAWFELVPDVAAPVRLAVAPGDQLSASVTATRHAVRLRIRNRSRGTSFSTTRHVQALDRSSAEWIAEAPLTCTARGSCRVMRLADFGTMGFATARATSTGGHTGAIADPAWAATPIDLLPATASPEAPGAEAAGSAAAGPLAPPGDGFPVSFARVTSTGAASDAPSSAPPERRAR